MLAVEEVGALSAEREEDVLGTSVVDGVERGDNVPLALHVHAKDGRDLLVVWLDEQGALLNQLAQVLVGDVQDKLRALLAHHLNELVVVRGVNACGKASGDHEALKIV